MSIRVTVIVILNDFTLFTWEAASWFLSKQKTFQPFISMTDTVYLPESKAEDSADFKRAIHTQPYHMGYTEVFM